MSESEHGDAFAKARDQQQAWKHAQIKRYAVAFVKRGIELGNEGMPFVGSDDVPEDAIPGGDSPGIAGSAIVMLTHAGVIEQWNGSIHLFGRIPIVAGRRRSSRPSANGRKVNVYKIINRGLAEAFLKANGAAVEKRQRELVLT